MPVDKEERFCKNCYFYEERDGEMVCGDFDGEYFLWDMRPTEHCPDFKGKKTGFDVFKDD